MADTADPTPPPPLSPKAARLASDLAAFEAASGRGADPATASTDGHVDHAPTEPPAEKELEEPAGEE